MNMYHAFGYVFPSSLFTPGLVSELLLGLAFGLFLLFFFVIGFCHRVLLIRSTLRGSRLFSRDGFARTLARARVGVRPLAAHRQVLAMTQAPIRSHINVTLDIH